MMSPALLPPPFFCESSSSGSSSTEPDGEGFREGGREGEKNILHFTPSSKLSFVYTLFFFGHFQLSFPLPFPKRAKASF